MMGWNAFGVVAACAWCGFLLTLGVWKIFNAESQSRRERREDFELGARPPAPGSLCALAAPCGPSGSLRSGNPMPSARAHLASALKQKPFTTLIFLSFAALATVQAQKQGQLRIENGELRMENGEARI